MAPIFQAPSSATKNCGQFGSRRPMRSPRRTPIDSRARPERIAFAVQTRERHRRTLEEQRGGVGPIADRIVQIIEQGPIRIRPEG